jgi:hypothetical protein
MEVAGRLAALPAQALRDTKRAANLHLEQAMATVLDAALDAERESMKSAEHAAIVARLIAKGLGGRERLRTRAGDAVLLAAGTVPAALRDREGKGEPTLSRSARQPRSVALAVGAVSDGR